VGDLTHQSPLKVQMFKQPKMILESSQPPFCQTDVSGSTVLLDETQTAIMQGKICPYCKGKTQYVDSTVIYGKTYGMIYLCKPCDAYCGVHKGTDNALGRLANKELRHWKKEAHKYFDVIWKDGHEKRGVVYKHLSNHLKLPVDYCHIGMFSVKTCQEVVDWSKMILNDLRRPAVKRCGVFGCNKQ